MVKPWNELFEKSVAVDTVEKFQRKLSEFGYYRLGYGSGSYTDRLVF